jgi:hypothetical protein
MADDGIEQAFAVLDLMKRAGAQPDVVTYNRYVV